MFYQNTKLKAFSNDLQYNELQTIKGKIQLLYDNNINSCGRNNNISKIIVVRCPVQDTILNIMNNNI